MANVVRIASHTEPVGELSPAVVDFVDVSFRWRLASQRGDTVLLGGRILLLAGGQEVFRVDPGDRFLENWGDWPNLVQAVGFLTEMPPGAVAEVSGFVQLGVNFLRGLGPIDVVVAVADAAAALGQDSPELLAHQGQGLFSVAE